MCPYANLLVARALSVSPEGKTSKAAALAAGAVLGHWSDRKEKKYYLFGMGTDFKKLKFPKNDDVWNLEKEMGQRMELLCKADIGLFTKPSILTCAGPSLSRSKYCNKF